jgi:Tol biopolymer transport system component
MNRATVIVCLLLLSHVAFSQAKIRRLPNAINNPSINVFAPFICLDGSSILFTSDYADDGTLVYYSQRESGDWKQPIELPKHLNSRLNFLKGYSLSADGKTLYITSAKSGGVGGYDIWSSDLTGNTWSPIKNLFLPINTKGNEGCATFTPDGNTLFFMRCEKMDMQKADNCKIFMAKRKPGTDQWNDPVELPANVNTGNSQTPRIAADGETLVFASDRIGAGKRGMDLFVTKFVNDAWSDPISIDVVNTEKDDQYVSLQANGRYLLKEAPGKYKSEIQEYLLPDNQRPRGVMKVEGFIKDADGKPTPAYISVFDLYSNKRVLSSRPEADGSFFFYLLEGKGYEFSIDHEQSTYTYFSKQYDLMHDDLLRNEKINVTLKPIVAGDEIELTGLQFMPHSLELDNNAASELRRLTRLMKNVPLNFEVQVLLSGYLEDSVKTSDDLTEVMIDSTNVVLQKVDSLGQLSTQDSVVVKTRYHNDRTQKQAAVIVSKLTAAGIEAERLTVFVNARPEDSIENRRTTIKVVARPKRN